MAEEFTREERLAAAKLKHHALWAGVTIVLLVLALLLFTVSSAETDTTYVCIGSAMNCNVTEVSTLGWVCGAGGIVAILAVLVAVRTWISELPTR